MSGPSQSLVSNLLLRALSETDYALIGPNLEPAVLEKGAPLVQPDEPIELITFLGSGLSLMLGVRRPSVTIALHSLEGLAFIRATRGLVTIRSRSELEEFAGAAYGIPEAEYERLIGPLR